MDEIIDIHEAVFSFLTEYRRSRVAEGKNFHFSLRKSNQKNRLTDGFWFHGNENYLAVSFWSGMDWKNKTPNIFLRITKEGKTFLSISTKDSIRKSENCLIYLVNPLKLNDDGRDRWKRELPFSDYIESIESFLSNEKRIIDEIINDYEFSKRSEDLSNAIDFINEDTFDSWLSNVNQYRDGHSKSKIAFALTSFSVENYEPIKLSQFRRIPSQTPFLILVGENGSGKSSFLKAIATALGNKFYDENLYEVKSDWIINFTVYLSGRNNRFQISKTQSKLPNNYNIPFACFGPSRLVTDKNISQRMSLHEKNDRSSMLWGMFYPDGILKDLDNWMIQRLNDKQWDNKKQSIVFENIKQILIDIIPNLYDIREVSEFGTISILYFEEDLVGNKLENGVPFQYLSSGLRSLISLLGDMMLRLFDQQPQISDPAMLSGIVIIDEIDLHLHPNWQIKLPRILSDNFPHIQFIVSTHSPVPLLGIPKGSKIFNISRIAEKGVVVKSLSYINVSNLLPNTILTSPIFGMEQLSSSNSKNVSKINVDDSFEDISFFEKLEKKMEELSRREDIFDKKHFRQ